MWVGVVSIDVMIECKLLDGNRELHTVRCIENMTIIPFAG